MWGKNMRNIRSKAHVVIFNKCGEFPFRFYFTSDFDNSRNLHKTSALSGKYIIFSSDCKEILEFSMYVTN